MQQVIVHSQKFKLIRCVASELELVHHVRFTNLAVVVEELVTAVTSWAAHGHFGIVADKLLECWWIRV